MQRHQIYLDPHSVSIIDEFAEQADFSRSQLLRLAIDKLAAELAHTLSTLQQNPPKKLFDSFIGSLSLPGRTNIAEQEDGEYLVD